MNEHIFTRLKVSETYGVKLFLFDKKGAELYDEGNWVMSKAGNTFYLFRHTDNNGKKSMIAFHRVIMGLNFGDILFVDHWNGNGLDNRIINLRLCSKQQNHFNTKLNKNNTSGYKGVSLFNKNRWSAQITHNRKKIHLGYFDTPEEAYVVYCEKATKLFGEYARF